MLNFSLQFVVVFLKIFYVTPAQSYKTLWVDFIHPNLLRAQKVHFQELEFFSVASCALLEPMRQKETEVLKRSKSSFLWQLRFKTECAE